MMTFREVVAPFSIYSGKIEIAHIANEAAFFLDRLDLILGGGFGISLFALVQDSEDSSFRECGFVQRILCAVRIDISSAEEGYTFDYCLLCQWPQDPTMTGCNYGAVITVLNVGRFAPSGVGSNA